MTTKDELVAIISAEHKRHHNYGPSQMVFNVRCKCGHVGKQVSVPGEFERHVDEAIADAVLSRLEGAPMSESPCPSRFIIQRLLDPEQDRRMECAMFDEHAGWHRNEAGDLRWQSGAEVDLKDLLSEAGA